MLNKQAVSVLVFIALLISGLFFVSKEETAVFTGEPGGAPVEMVGVEIVTFEQGVKKLVAEANRASFMSPNVVELSDGVWGRVDTPQGDREFASEVMLAYFDSDRVLEVSSSAKLQSAYFMGEAVFRFQDLQLRTESAKYFGESETLVGSQPFSVQSKTLNFEGEEGFVIKSQANSSEFKGNLVGFYSEVPQVGR